MLFYTVYANVAVLMDAVSCRSVFPCGDEMVAIIDDREDVWGNCPNLIHVKPYVFFAGTSDINAPPGSTQQPMKTDDQPPATESLVKPEGQSKQEEAGSDSSSSGDNSSSTSSSDVDDTVFDELENSTAQPKQSKSRLVIKLGQAILPTP